MAPEKVKVTVEGFSDEAGSSVVNGLIRVQVLEPTSGGFKDLPVVIVFDVKLLDVKKMEKLIQKVFCEKKNTDITFFRSGGVEKTDGLTGVTYVELNLSGAIKKLESKLKRKVAKGLSASSNVGPAGFIIIVSDGGSKLPERDGLCEDLSKYPVHAIGLGSTHDSDLLQDIVKSSKGTYSYIPVTQDKEKLYTEVLEDIGKCLGGLTTVVAVDTYVEISVHMFEKSKGFFSCNTVNKQLKIQSGSGPYGIIPETNPREGKILIGCLYAGEVKQFVVPLAYKPATGLCQLTAAVMESNSHNEKKLLAEESKRFGVNSRSWGETVDVHNPSPALLEHMIRARVVDMLLSFAKDFKGHSKERLKKEGGEELQLRLENVIQEVAGNLRMLADLHKRHNCGRVDLAQAIGKEITAMAESLNGGSGLGPLYSWASSYQMQRPTTTGLPSPVAAEALFLTPDMDKAKRDLISNHLREQQVPVHPPAGGGGAAAAAASRTTRTKANKNKEPSPTAAQPALDDDKKRQLGNELLDKLVPLLEKKDKLVPLLEKEDKISLQLPSSSNHKSKHSVLFELVECYKEIEEEISKFVEAATRMTTTSGSGDKKVPAAASITLEDLIAIWLFDRIIKLNKKGYPKREFMSETCKVAEQAISRMPKKITTREDHPDGKPPASSSAAG